MAFPPKQGFAPAPSQQAPSNLGAQIVSGAPMQRPMPRPDTMTKSKKPPFPIKGGKKK